MAHPTHRIIRVFVAALVTLTFAATASAQPAAKPVLLYSRYFNAKGESRYLPDGTYKEILARLGETFDVRVSDAPLNAETLKGVAVVLIANPSDKAVGGNPAPHHVTPADVAAISRYVNDGGGLIAMGNQENHNLETKDFNTLLGAFGMTFEARYTDAKKLVIPKDVPVLGGLRWAYYTGNQVVLQPDHPAHPRGLIVNDLNQKPVQAPRDEPGVLLGVSEPGKGHVAVVTDAGWISNDALDDKGIGGVVIKDHDNFEICRRLTRWAAGLK